MPELPEVEYERRRLQRAMAGRSIRRVITRRANLRYAFPSDFARRLEGQTVRRVGRRAKYLVVELGSGDSLVMHLGMSGSFRITRARAADDEGAAAAVPYERHDHVVFDMSSGVRVVFNDPRRFGFMTLLSPGEVAAHPAIGRLGPEPLARNFDDAILATALGRRRTPLKIALSDQRVVAGLGNIYVSEALHRAGLSPKRRASTLVTRSGAPRPAVGELVTAIRAVLKTAIRNQYRTGARDPFLVYDRERERCLRRGCTGTIRKIVQGGRSTFYCPVCQR
jgi:formamidopyrimidine-DNA glycosylase